MNFVQAVLMGFVQGLSEFLPISSSAHLVFASNFYKVFKHIPIEVQSNEEVFLDIMLHLGTLIAVIIYFRHDIWKIIKSLIVSVKNKNFSPYDSKLGLYIIVGTIVTVALALPFNKVANHLVFHPVLVGGLLVITGLILFASEYVSGKVNKTSDLTDFKQALVIGLAQGLAVLPGFSRSGWTIAAGLFTGLDRTSAGRFSFLLSIPIILGASMIYPIVEIDISQAAGYNWSAIIAGTFISCITGYICIKYFMKFIAKFSLNIFGVYCLLMGIFAVVFFGIFC